LRFPGRTDRVKAFIGETYPVEAAAVGYKPLYDSENLKAPDLISAAM
jgi:hypothetical protein